MVNPEYLPDYQAMMAQQDVDASYQDMDAPFFDLYEDCRKFTMTSIERLYALWSSLRYIVNNKIPGAIVECGVWRGGSMRLAARTFQSLGIKKRALYLYDTFEGMTEPCEKDIDHRGHSAVGDWRYCQDSGIEMVVCAA